MGQDPWTKQRPEVLIRQRLDAETAHSARDRCQEGRRCHQAGCLALLDLVALKPDARLGKKARTPRKARDVPVLEQARQLSHRPARVYEVIRAIYRWAISRDILPADPTFGMKPPLKKERPRERALTAKEIKQFWSRLGDTPLSDGVQLAMKLALVTAQRIGEVSNIAKTELALDGPTPIWSLPAERSKNREGHRIPLSPLAIRIIKEAQRLEHHRIGRNRS